MYAAPIQSTGSKPLHLFKQIFLPNLNLNKQSVSEHIYSQEVMYMSKYTILDTIKFNEYTMKFKSKYELWYTQEESGFFCENEELGINCYGDDLNSLLTNFNEEIVVAWKLYVECDESELTDKAKLLRYKLISLINRIN